MEIERLEQKGAASRGLDVIVRTTNELTRAQERKVEEAGLAVGSVSGDIFTASGSYAALLKTAGFDFVIYIDLSRKLRKK